MNKNPIKWSVAALALLALIVLAWPGTAPVSGLRLSSFDSPISPIATPVIPPPPPTPDPSAEARAALVFLAQREGIALENLAIVNEFRRDSALLGRTFQAVTVFDAKARRFFHVLVDRQSGQVEDVTAIETAEEQAHQAKYGKLEPALYERLQTAADSELIEIAIWIAGKPRRSQEELFAELAARFPEARAAMERSGKPFDVDDPEVRARIELAYSEMLAEDTQPLVQPVVDYLSAQAYTVTTFDGMPAITAVLPKHTILDLNNRPDVGRIFLIEGDIQPMLESAIAAEQSPDAPMITQETGLILLGGLILGSLVAFRAIKGLRRKRRAK